MADEKLNTGPAENISPEAAEPIATPEPVSYTHLHAMNNKQEEELTALTNKFNETNEYGITVNLTNQGAYSDLSSKLTAVSYTHLAQHSARMVYACLTRYVTFRREWWSIR